MSLAEQGKYGRGRTLAIRRWLVYSLAGLFAFLILAVLYIWVQRYALLETALRNQLSARGIDAELRIEHADWTRAVVRDLKLRDGSEIFFSSDRIVVDYQWRDAIRGRVNYVEIHKPHARATLDASGRIQDTWYLKQIRNSGDASGMDLPARGIVVRHGRFDITSPYGRVTGTVSGDFKSMDDVTADMDLEPSNMSFGDFSATLSGSAKFTLSPDVNQGTSRIEPDIVIGDWRYGDFSGERVQLAGQADVVRSDSGVTMSGDISANSRAMDFGYLRLDSGTAGWSGTLEMQDRNGGGTVLDGFWQGQFTGVTVMDDERRRNMAEAVTMYKALSVSPIVRNFAETLTLDIQNLMVDGEVSTKAHVSKSGADTVVSLDGPLTWSSGNRRLTLEQGTDMPFYTFDPVGKIITLDFNGNFDGRHAVSFESGKLVMGPQTGDSRTGLGNFRIQGFNSIVQTAGIWRRTLPDRRSVRLAPVRASVDYVNLDHDRRLTVSGAIDYDGEIPGGYVKGLNMQGQLDLDLTGPTKVGYAPTRGTRISIDEFQSVAGWHGRNIGFDLRDTKELYVQNPDGSGVLGVEVSRGTAEFVRIGTPQKINLGYGKASVIADINARGQNWRMDGQDVVMTSDTVPGPGTRMEAEELSLTVNMQKGDRLQFSLETSGAAAKTQLVDAHDFRITGGGTATDYTFNYADGRVKFPAAQWPVLPVSGSVRFADGQWSGDAVTFLPLAETSPINVVYMFRDRQGTARVDIVDLPFHPSALQPQHLIPALQGRVADVRGRASAQIDLIFGAGAPVRSSGTVRLENVSLGTLPGPVTDVNSEMRFSSFFPLQTDGEQFLTMKAFDPGLPLENGEVRFELVPAGVNITRARWPLGDGFISLDPTKWRYTAPENQITLRVEGVSLAEFLNDKGNGRLIATGDIDGVLPLVISGVKVDVVDGQLFVKDGGVIQYGSEQTDSAVAQIEHAKFAFDALGDFRYRELKATINGPLDGNILVGMVLDGFNPEVLGGAPFRFNITLEGELLNIARNFNIGQRIGAGIVSSIHGESLDAEEIITKP